MKRNLYQKISYRPSQVAHQLHRELAQLIREKFFNKMITLTDSKISKDLSSAKFFFSVLKEEEIKPTLLLLAENAKSLRQALAKRMALRKVPEIFFIYDETAIRSHRLLGLINTDSSKNEKKPSRRRRSAPLG